MWEAWNRLIGAIEDRDREEMAKAWPIVQAGLQADPERVPSCVKGFEVEYLLQEVLSRFGI